MLWTSEEQAFDLWQEQTFLSKVHPASHPMGTGRKGELITAM
jgi:hypothetical protein